MKGRQRTCPVKGCGGELVEDRVVCQACWRRLPAWARNKVWQAWRRGKHDERVSALRIALEWFRANPAACDASGTAGS